MRKWISLLLALVMVFTFLPMTAYAADKDKLGEEEDKTSIRHQVYDDVSKIEVGDELSGTDPGTAVSEAKIGTDVYLFVDPDTASYVVFTVTDENGDPIEGAEIWISYRDYKEFYGLTNEDGKFATYLFRDVEYGYIVVKEGFETVEGTFTATKELKHVRVVMRRYYTLDIYVVDGDKPVPGVTLIIEGNEYITDENGKATAFLTNGVYDVVLVTPDGRRIPVKAEVDGNSVLIIDISKDDALIPGGMYSDRFLVYDRDYDPEDYVLTKYVFAEDDVPQNQSKEYLNSVTNTILVEAQPDRRQSANGPDVDILDNNQKPIYSQRSLMPSGFLLKAWEEQGIEKIVFTNEEMGLSFPINSLHSGDMMKLYGIIRYLDNWRINIDEIATEETVRYSAYEQAGLKTLSRWALELDRVDLDCVKDFVFEFENDEKADAAIEDMYYLSSLFEFRITPILPESMLEMLSDGIVGAQALVPDEIMLASWGYYAEQLRLAASAGNLTEAEYDELYYFFVDGRLSKDEILKLRQLKSDKKLSKEALQTILDAAADEKLYRVSCWLCFEEINVDISDIISGLELVRLADDKYQQQLEQLSEDKTNRKKSEVELSDLAETALEERYEFSAVDYDPYRYTMKDYEPGEFIVTAQPKLVRALDEDGKFYDVMSEKSFEQLIVDVREGNIAAAGRKLGFTAEIEYARTKLEQSRALVADMKGILLALLSYK